MPHAEVKQLRTLEAQLARARRYLTVEKQKRQQAESELTLAERNLETALATRGKVKPKQLSRRTGRKSAAGQATAVLCCNDWHAEARITKESVGGVNEFNLKIADQRIRKTWQKALYLLAFVRGISNIRELVVWLGGDLVNGTIHEELEESNFLGPTEAVLYVQDHVASGLELLLKEAQVDRITVVTSFGNHGRTTRKRRIATGYRHSWEFLCYQNLARYFARRAKIRFQVGQGYHNWLTVQNCRVRFHHGDAVRYGGGVGGVTIPLRKKIAQWNKCRRADLDVLGHFHTACDSQDAVLSGALVGFDPYALEIGADFQPPSQAFIVIDRQYGKVLTVPIFCG